MNWFWRRKPNDDDRLRAEALVEAERRGMMGGRTPAMKIRPVLRAPRLRPADGEEVWMPIGTVSLLPPGDDV